MEEEDDIKVQKDYTPHRLPTCKRLPVGGSTTSGGTQAAPGPQTNHKRQTYDKSTQEAPPLTAMEEDDDNKPQKDHTPHMPPTCERLPVGGATTSGGNQAAPGPQTKHQRHTDGEGSQEAPPRAAMEEDDDNRLQKDHTPHTPPTCKRLPVGGTTTSGGLQAAPGPRATPEPMIWGGPPTAGFVNPPRRPTARLRPVPRVPRPRTAHMMNFNKGKRTSAN